MNYDKYKHYRCSIRLREYDYSQAGAYFVTVRVQNRECLFGDVVDGGMRLNDAGQMVKKCWDNIPAHFPHVELDEYIIMPNHVHGIIAITDTVGAKNFSPLHSAHRFQSPSKTIGSIVRGFKIGVTKWFRRTTDIVVWQRNYYEHIIRNEDKINRIREYIIENPAKWAEDENNPVNIANRRGEKFFAPTNTNTPWQPSP